MLKITFMVYLPHARQGWDPAGVIDLARIAEGAGFDGIGMGEHLALGSSLENYPYQGGLKHGQQGVFLEPVATLGAWAAATNRVRLSTSIMIAPLRPAVLLAKQLATLDVLSRGRLEPALGVGWNRDEYGALGVEFAARRRILRDNIAAARALWGEQPASFSSDTVSFDGLHSLPRPVQSRIPILIGLRSSEANARIIAEIGDGWECGPDDSKSPEKLRDGIAMIRDAYEAAGRDPADLLVRAFLPLEWNANDELDIPATLDGAAGLAELGVNRFVWSSACFRNIAPTMAALSALIEQIGKAAEAY